MEKTIQSLKRYDPEIQAKVKGHDLYRIPYAFPVFRPGYLEIMKILATDKTAQGPIYLAGDYTLYATFDGAAASAYRAVRSMGLGS